MVVSLLLSIVQIAALSYVSSGLSAQEQCSQATCDTLAQILVCEAFGIEMPRICAKYLLGSQMDCPKYPHDLLDAPYICKDHYGDLASLSTLINADYSKQPVDSLTSAVQALAAVRKKGAADRCLADDVREVIGAGPLGYDSYEELCAVDCFHNYLIRLNNMFSKCATSKVAVASEEEFQMPTTETASFMESASVEDLPDTDAISPLQLQMCTYNPMIDMTCLDAVSGSDTALEFTCPYPPAVLCKQFQPLGCCMGTTVTMGQQMDDTVMPPCLLQILANCPVPVVANSFCATGLMTNATTMSVPYKFVQRTPGPSILPNMYNETEVRKLMGAFAGCFVNLPVTADMCTITDFSYEDADGNPITNYMGVKNAVSATYTIQLSLVASKSPQLIGALHPFVPTDAFAEFMATNYGLGSAVEATALDGAQFNATIVPMEALPDAAQSSSAPSMFAIFVLLLGTVLSLLH